jgi:ABC-2 type transport system ATP-binding protein
MDEAESLADRVAIMANGAIVATGRPTDLVGGGQRTMVRFRVPAAAALPRTLGARADHSGTLVIETTTPTAALHTLTSWALEAGIELDGLSVSRATLEEAYLRLTGGEVST